MRIIEPKNPQPNELINSSIPESTVEIWSSSKSYSVGNQVRVFTDGSYQVYEAAIANVGQNPANAPVNQDGASYWTPKGSTARWAMFDGSVNSPSVQDDGQPLTFSYAVGPGGRVNSIALFNVIGTDITIYATSELAGGEVYREERETQGSRGPGYWQFYFGETEVKKRFQFFGIPPYPDTVIHVEVTPRGGVAQIGEAVFGQDFLIGTDEIGMQPRIKDYSINQFNEDFGYNTLVKRQTRRQLQISVVIPSERADIVFSRLEKLASVRVVWISDKYESGTIYGFYSDFTPTHSSHPLVFASLKIEGLI